MPDIKKTPEQIKAEIDKAISEKKPWDSEPNYPNLPVSKSFERPVDLSELNNNIIKLTSLLEKYFSEKK